SLKTSIKTITYLSDIGCLEIQGASLLSFMGLPCPNLFTGGYNYHGKHEFVTLEGMEKAVQVIVRIAELTAKRGQ
ncbi:hypothetical protein NP084_22550, partial [Salmonella enterica]|nr:hypothetical protein [Salmonella enterica]